jgi:esterase
MTATAVDLAFDTVGDAESSPPVVICHGLFGSRRNFQPLAKAFAPHRRVVLADMRNHGESPWDEAMDYAVMAADLARLIEEECGGRASVVGHSMGGKAAMTLALNHPETIDRLVVGDIAPVVYTGGRHHLDLIRAMRAADLSVKTRSDVEAQLMDAAPEPVTRAFALHNLTRGADGRFSWRPNLAVLEARLGDLTGFPDSETGAAFDGPVLFVRGGQSRYVKDEALPVIERLFPSARVETLAESGHWVHAEDPDGFRAAVADFLGIPQ